MIVSQDGINRNLDQMQYLCAEAINEIIFMGAEQGKQGPHVPQKSMKEMVKEYTVEINGMRREYQKEKMKLEYQGKVLQKDLKKKIDKNEPKQAQKLQAQQIMRNNQMVGKYMKLDGQLQNMTFELQTMCMNESMQNVMTGMAKIMSGASNKMKNADYQETMKRFISEKERMAMLNEYVQDVMGADDEEIEDQDVDKLLGEFTAAEEAKKQKRLQAELQEYQENLDKVI